MLLKYTTFDNSFVNFSLNVTHFGMPIDNIKIDMSHAIGCYGNRFLKLGILQLSKCMYLYTWLSQRQYTSYSIELYIIGKGWLPAFS